jgi:hypothetical protein
MKILSALTVCILLVGMATATARADLYGFQRISNNAPENVASQFAMDVTSRAANQVTFTFTNTAVIPASITDVYFEVPDWFASLIVPMEASAGVKFTPPAKPGHLPEGNTTTPEFHVTPGYSADSDPPVQPNGINAANEYLKITFQLAPNRGLSSVLAALNDGDVRVGLRAQGIGANEESDSFISNGAVVPAPPALLLGCLGLGLLYRRRRAA